MRESFNVETVHKTKHFPAANDWTIRGRERCGLLSNYFDH